MFEEIEKRKQKLSENKTCFAIEEKYVVTELTTTTADIRRKVYK